MSKFQIYIGNKVINASVKWRNQGYDWHPSLILCLGDLSNSFVQPENTAHLLRIIEEFNEGDFYNDIPSPDIANIQQSQLESALELIKASIDSTKPSESVFAMEHKDCSIFTIGNQEVAVNCEWFSDNGEKWSFCGLVLTENRSVQINYKPNLNDVQKALSPLVDSRVTDLSASLVKAFICAQYDDRPVISAHEGYYGG